MPKFRKKPVVIEAIRFDGTNAIEVIKFIGLSISEDKLSGLKGSISIPTLEGIMRADNGDWIIKGVKGEFYPCKPDIFSATYEPVTD